MQIVPLQPIAAQTLRITLGGQVVDLKVYQRRYGVFMDISIAGTLIIGGVICENLNRIVRSVYLGFIGDFVFMDTQGSSDPDYTGFGSRFVLAYLEASDLSQIGYAA